MSLANETDFGERVSVIRTSILSSLNELQTIIDKSLPHAYAYSHVESERLRQQTRANVEAVKACEAEERVRDLELALSMIIEKAERNPSANDVLAIARAAWRLVGRFEMRTVMIRLQSMLPGVNRLVLVRVQHSMRFAARMVLIGNNMPWPYWEIAGTEGERLRKADHRDLWCYWPEESPDVLHTCDCGAEWEGPATEAKCGHCIRDAIPPNAPDQLAGASPAQLHPIVGPRQVEP